MINNFEKIKELIEFHSDDTFYMATILKRKKENPEIGSNSYVVKTYFIKSLEDLEFYREEMICLAKFHNARVYINLNPRSFEKTAFNTLKKVTDQIMNKDFKSVRKAYNSVCGMHSEGDKKWIIDVDYPSQIALHEIRRILVNIAPIAEDKYITTIPTKNGYHVITKPFNVEQFKNLMPGMDIHKNNPSVLFIP